MAVLREIHFSVEAKWPISIGKQENIVIKFESEVQNELVFFVVVVVKIVFIHLRARERGRERESLSMHKQGGGAEG